MSQRSSVPARTLAVTALVGGLLVLVVVIAGSLGGEGGDDRDGRPAATKSGANGDDGDSGGPPKFYVVQNGDTLTAIAHENGVPVSRIEELNPGVDPQILVSGEKLKLR